MTTDNSKNNIADEQLLNIEQSSQPIIEDEEPTAPGWSKKDIKHNIFVMVMLMTVFELGWDDFSMALQPFLAHLKMSNTLTGLIMGAHIAALPGLFLSPFISRKLKHKKVYAWGANIIYILMIGLLGISVVFAEKFGFTRSSLITITVVLIVSHHVIAGFVSLPVREFVSGCIPSSFRGRYSGISHTTGSIAGLITTALGGWILYSQPAPTSYGYLFLITWIICSISWTVALFAREKPISMDKVPKAWSKEMIMAALTNKPFVRLAIVACLSSALLSGGTSFVQQYAYKELHLKPYNAAIFSSISLFGRLAVSVPIGLLVDRYGPKKFIPYWGICQAIGLSFVIIFPNEWGAYLQIFSNVAIFGIFAMAISVLNASLPKPEHRAGTYTISMIVGGLAGTTDKIIGGALCDAVGYRPAFMIFAIGCVLCTPAWFWVARSLRDDRKDLY